MSHSTISIPSDFTGESVRSSPSLVILSDTELEVIVVPIILPEIAPEAEAALVASPTPVLDLAIESDLEVEPSKALPSPDYVSVSHIHAPTSPGYHPRLDTESVPFEDEFEPIEDDSLEASEPLPAQVSPPPLVQITPTSSTEPTAVPCVISWAAPSLPYFGSSHRRSCHVSSSSSTSSAPSGPLPRRRHQISSYSTSLTYVRPSRKRCRPSTTSLPATSSTPAVLSYVLADRLLPRKSQAIEDRLDEQSEMIGGMYKHLLDMPLSRIEETMEEL
uniref:Uncharacterized protein n=1 Tax=Tanacetum cinerariifolium TaxID=118510 RepID=A0A6L2KGL0_TANCI|nr:hypothetical protein [Tanacetum cinerariifolium]